MKQTTPSSRPGDNLPSAAAAGKKTRRRRVIILIVVLLLVLAAALFFLLPRLLGGAPETTASVAQSAQVTTGTVSNSIVGTGSLTAGETASVDLPSGLVIDEVYVSSGDAVQAGDLLASVEESSLTGVLQSLQSSIDSVDEELETALEDSEDETELTSSLSGRVIKIYAAEGDSAADVVAEHGALMLLSVDGKMALRLEEAGSLAAGNEVTVTLSDGTEKEGTVESTENGAVITIGDSGTALDETVTVTDADGNDLGNASLYIHQEIAVTAVSGTVVDLEVSEGESIDAGDTLCTLENTGTSAAVQELTSQRTSLQEQLQTALQIAQDGGITAPADGVVQSVNVSSTSSGSTSTSSGTTSYLSAGNSGTQTAALTLLSASLDPDGESGQTPSEDAESEGTEDGGETPSDNTEETPSDDTEETPPVDDTENSGADTGDGTEETPETVISDFSALTVTAPATGDAPQAEIAETEAYTGQIVWQTSDTVFAADTTYQARVTLTAKEGYCFSSLQTPLVNEGVGCLVSGLSWSEDGKTVSFLVTFAATEAESAIPETPGTGSEDSQNSGSLPSGTGSGFSSGGYSFGGGASSGGSSVSVSSADSVSSTESAASSDETSSDTVSAFTLSTSDSMLISISVDELDINTIAVGQSAQIALDAIDGETFSGTVTSVSSIGTSSGGSTQYTVSISFEATEEMKLGMNATATITTEEAADVLTIPVNALQQSGSQVFVYTSVGEDGSLSGEVEVETGLSDGETVEIISGLEEGQTVYYLRTGSDSAGGAMSFGGGMDFGGQMPDMGGGQMPDMGGGQRPDMGGGQMPGAAGG